MTAFDFPAFKRAVERKDVEAWSSFYADDADWIEFKPSAPPRAPRVMRGRAEIEAFLHAVAADPVRLELSHELVGEERAAFRVTCTLPDGRRIVEHAIAELRGGLIAQVSEVEAWD